MGYFIQKLIWEVSDGGHNPVSGSRGGIVIVKCTQVQDPLTSIYQRSTIISTFTMIPFIPTLILAFVSFISSAFVIFRIVIPILPPHPLSRRVAPSEFGLPDYNFRSLSSADKSHLWLASLDILALCVFIWQAFSEYYGGPASYGEAHDAASSARLWFALTIRQTCLFVVSALTLINIRMGRSVSFGSRHWMLWAPTLLLGLASTILSGFFAAGGIPSLFVGLLAYSTTVAVLSSASFGSLVYTLVVIRRNLAALNDPADSWPPTKEVEDKPRPSFATEDVDVLREGSSWLTSDAGSTHQDSVSNWSFSTHQAHPRPGSLGADCAVTSKTSLAPKSSYWFDPPTPMTGDALIPPVPSLPSSCPSSPADALSSDPDPFRRDAPGRPRLDSQSSWLTSPSGSQISLSAWSYPTSHQGGVSAVDLNAELLPQCNRPPTPALSTARVLGGYGYQGDSERGIASLAYNGNDVDISIYRYACWMITIWVPLVLSLPYILSFVGKGFVSSATPLLLALSVTLSSPLLAMNIIMRSPIPIPTGLFDVHGEPPSICMRAPSPAVTLTDCNRECKRSGSVTVVEGRRSGDVWLSQGDAVEGKGKLSRALGLMTPVPRLAVLPPEDEKEDGEMTPPLPMQTESESFNTSVFPNTPGSAEFGRIRKQSVQSRISGDEFASRIMVAQRHYSALATTVIVTASPEKKCGDLLTVTTGVGVERKPVLSSSSHLRSRSVSSVIGQAISTDYSPSPSRPPSQPLPPTPPNVRLAKQQSTRTLIHRKSYSSGYSFGATVNDDVNEIDVLTAGVLPLLVPGLKVGNDMKLKDFEFEFDPPVSSTVTKKKRLPASCTQKDNGDFGVLANGEGESTALHSTTANGKVGLNKASAHKRYQFSLPSLGLRKDTVDNLKSEIGRTLATRIGGYTTVNDGRGNTAWADESASNLLADPPVNVDKQPVPNDASLGRTASTRTRGLRAEVPHGMESARTSVATLDTATILPPSSAASTVTLFDPMTEFDPAAQSTPLHEKEYHFARKHQAAAMPRSQPTSKRSSIVYIRSSEKHTQAPSEPEAQPPTERNNTDDMSSLTVAQWSTQVVKPLILASKQRKDATGPTTKSSSNSLRTLSLLKDRDSNHDSTGDARNGFAGTRPLVLGKKKSKTVKEHDENVAPSASSVNKHLKPLKLSRTESSKVRGMLRKDETLPIVLVRPPSDRMESIYEVR
ncbi:uncharacterized protein F5147DRAFT_754033 [Suillus discolor]|uniref:Transmembrane protein n=1 Tax=Suillus discolor TaxID=1912936 RepID=A0A9P7JSI2_9AGAM|nr:uncharacterized protein F5147DRAFT_754033 [Suillus discolor]KAG2105097.1 hypothetical protein F5147DRAFT_754033 [Suillus discolor]